MTDQQAGEIHWRDMAGRVHRCRVIDVDDETRIVVTACKFDVPPNEAYQMEANDPIEPITCPLCLSGEDWGGSLAERYGGEPGIV